MSSVHPADGGLQPTRPNPIADDEPVSTPTRGDKTKAINSSKVEKTIKFRFVPSKDNDAQSDQSLWR